jgi:phosphoenolpyruvate synthase/pyruvate phosphate dikinase
MEFVRTLADVGRNDIAMAGGKGANLGELMRAKLPVPPGFVLLTSAYKAFVEANELTEEIERLASKASFAEIRII